MEYQIIEHGITVGKFQTALDRNNAFDEYFVNTSRSGFKKDSK